jgi:hypothetical protein
VGLGELLGSVQRAGITRTEAKPKIERRGDQTAADKKASHRLKRINTDDRTRLFFAV